MLYKPELSGPDNGARHMMEDEEEEEQEPPRNFTQKQLREFDGTPDKDGNDKPVYLSVNGIVFDMSTGRNFYGPGGPYEKFAGRECGVGKSSRSATSTRMIDDMRFCFLHALGDE